VLYEDRNGEALLDLLPELLAPEGQVLITDPRRPNAKTLLRPLPSMGWQVMTKGIEHARKIDESEGMLSTESNRRSRVAAAFSSELRVPHQARA
jgi:hypothetical protein